MHLQYKTTSMTFALFEITSNGLVILADTKDLFGYEELTFLHQREAASLLESELRKGNAKLKGKRFTILPYFDDGKHQPIMPKY